MSIWLIGKATETQPVEEESPREVVLHPPGVEFEPVGERKVVEPEIDPFTPGSVEGFVRFAGEKKPRIVISLAGDAYCQNAYLGRELFSEKWVWGEEDTVQNVLVHVTGGLPQKIWNPPTETKHVRLEECRFSPHVLAVMSGQPVGFQTNETNFHPTQIRPKLSPPMSFLQSDRDMILPWLPEIPELGIEVTCDRHSWMSGYIHVLSHPFFDLTGPQGSFTIADLPPGEYELSLWHEVKAFRDSVVPIKVKIEPGKTTRVDFTIKPEQK